ncbi:recombinase family protein [Polaromonas sp. AET17H-212]|uniref:recombinase family protein n=1 Tax=Polaromonas sp. AET17H-212 TaxID=1977061 RepID=UPI000BBB71B8|nr:recombinase family protein [Polaromonas sp. AET17H-212]
MQNFVAYVRVSTQRQGASGLGLDAQRAAVASYLRGRGSLVGEIVEIESGRKAGKARPELAKALAACKAQGAALVIGKLDRLARDVRFFLEVIDDSGVDIRFADLPDVCPASDEGRMILVSMANFAEFEGRRIGTRTKAALAAAKVRGIQLGLAGRHNLKPNIEARQAAAGTFAAGISGLVAGFRARSLSQRAMVAELNAAKVPAPRGGDWRLSQVQRLLGRLPVTL